MSTVAVLGTLDTKGEEHAFVAELIRAKGHQALLIDVGTGNPPSIAPDISRETVAAAKGVDLAALTKKGDRGECVTTMSLAAPILVQKLVAEGKIDGIISLGGGGGTAIGTAAMRALPIGFPKVMVSTLAGGNTAPYVACKDIVMFPSITDVAGLNRLSRVIFAQAAGAVCGMIEAASETEDRKPLIVASMFGNTTEGVSSAKKILEKAGYEVLVFSASGTGGKTMEALIESGMVSGVLDFTTTELADELVGGVLTAGPDRMKAAAKAKIPVVVVPGCLDMVNFHEADSVPKEFSNRTFYQHNPQVTLMRTSPEESAQLGKLLAENVNNYSAPTVIMIPKKAISVISAAGQAFHSPDADKALFEAIQDHSQAPVKVFDEEINSPTFAHACAEELLSFLK